MTHCAHGGWEWVVTIGSLVLMPSLITTMQHNPWWAEDGWSPTAWLAERAESRQGLWYVWNAAKANRKTHTPVSNEINASSFSGAYGKSDRHCSRDLETVGDFSCCWVNE